MGTISFCIVAFLLKWTPFSTNGHHQVNVLRFRLDAEDDGTTDAVVRRLLAEHCSKTQHWRSDYVTDAEGKLKTEHNYRVIFKEKSGELPFLLALKSVGGISKIDLSTRSEPEAL